MDNISERDLVLRYKNAKDNLEQIKEQLSEGAKELDKAEAALIELLTAKDAKSTAKYLGVGYVTLVKPRLFARYNKDNEDKVFSFLKENNRQDMIKETVHAQSLSSFVKDRIEAGQDIPEYIPYYMKQSIKLYSE